MYAYQVMNSPIMKVRQSSHMAGHSRLGQVCPNPGSSFDPSTFGPEVACQRTSSGDIICSNNVIYSGSCPMAPSVNVDGTAPDNNGIPMAPAPLTSAATSSTTPGGVVAPSSFPILPVVGVAAAGVLAILLLA